MKEKLQHGNATRRYYHGEIHDISATYKSHRIPISKEVQALADEIYRLIQLFQLEYPACNQIIRNKFKQGVGRQNFWDHFLCRIYGVGFNPRPNTLEKYYYLRDFLQNKEKEFAKKQTSSKVSSQPKLS